MSNSVRAVPTGVRTIAALFAICGIYLGGVAVAMLVRPGLIGMSSGAPLLFGLELAGPWMFLLTSAIGFAIALGLMRLSNLARHAATLIAIAGIVMLVPPVSAAAVMVEPKPLVWNGLGIIVRVMVAWYLYKSDVAEQFKKPQPG